jgi:predicted NBD/HSP70 family sugar kinase
MQGNWLGIFKMADRSTSKVLNKRTIIDLIYNEDGISRAKLAKVLGMSKPSVADHVGELLDIGLVLEVGEGRSTTFGGRKPVMLHFNYKYKHIAIVDLSFREPVCAIADLKGNFCGTRRITWQKGDSALERRIKFYKALAAILKENSLENKDLGVLVFSQPGIVSEKGLEYSEVKHHTWAELDLPEYLEKLFKIPVLVKNDVNLAAVGEFNLGLKGSVSNLIYITCGVGLGAGIIINGRLFEGDGFAAGEIGDIMLRDRTRLEDSVAMEGLLKNDATFNDYIDGLNVNDEKIIEAVQETGLLLGRAIYNICVAFDIKLAIFGGEYLELGSTLLDKIKEAARGPRLQVDIREASLGESAGIHGGFILGKEMIFQDLAEQV